MSKQDRTNRQWPEWIEWMRPQSLRDDPYDPHAETWLRSYVAELESGKFGEIVGAWFDPPSSDRAEHRWEPCAVTLRGATYLIVSEDYVAKPRHLRINSETDDLNAALTQVRRLRPWHHLEACAPAVADSLALRPNVFADHPESFPASPAYAVDRDQLRSLDLAELRAEAERRAAAERTQAEAEAKRQAELQTVVPEDPWRYGFETAKEREERLDREWQEGQERQRRDTEDRGNWEYQQRHAQDWMPPWARGRRS